MATWFEKKPNAHVQFAGDTGNGVMGEAVAIWRALSFLKAERAASVPELQRASLPNVVRTEFLAGDALGYIGQFPVPDRFLISYEWPAHG